METQVLDQSLNIIDRKAEVLLRFVPVPLAGGGPALQAIQVDELLEELKDDLGVLVRRIGIRGPKPAFVDEQITGRFYALDRAIEPAENVHDIYKNATKAIQDDLSRLYVKGVRHFAAVCCGYTSYGALAFHKAIESINGSNPQDPMTGNVLVQDSSFPDTDVLSTDLDEEGCPATRFYGPAYRSSTFLRIVFTVNGAVPFDVRLSKRRPEGCDTLMTTVPFSERYAQVWKSAGSRPVEEARRGLSQHIAGIERVEADAWVVSLLASGGIWDAANIGKWMRQPEFDTVALGTLTMVKALHEVVRRTNRSIFFLTHANGVDFILNHQLPEVTSIDEHHVASKSVYLLKYENLEQSRYMDLITSSNLVINRAVQANSFVETILALRPQLVITMPAAGYMEAELMAEDLPIGRMPYDTLAFSMADELERLLTDQAHAATYVTTMLDVFNQMNDDPQSSFSEVLAFVAGLR